jgi:hypothetical protein
MIYSSRRVRGMNDNCEPAVIALWTWMLLSGANDS